MAPPNKTSRAYRVGYWLGEVILWTAVGTLVVAIVLALAWLWP